MNPAAPWVEVPTTVPAVVDRAPALVRVTVPDPLAGLTMVPNCMGAVLATAIGG